ncbi:hypothetical protein ABC304_10030 [Microbacterium sp. 1P10UB]|uniref:hypothetical protein n=1 Tax=unclassified Microbacterium TaxID=2609290 RepID=UPI0039A17DF8
MGTRGMRILAGRSGIVLAIVVTVALTSTMPATAAASPASAPAPALGPSMATCETGWDGPDHLIAFGIETELVVCTLNMPLLNGPPVYVIVNPTTTVWRVDAGTTRVTAAVTNSAQTRALTSTIPLLSRPDYLLGPGDQLKVFTGFASSLWTADTELTLGWYGIDLAAKTISEQAIELGIVTSTEALFAKSAWRTALNKCAIGVYGAIPKGEVSATAPAVSAFLDGAGNTISGGICLSALAKARRTVSALPFSWTKEVPIALEKMGNGTGVVKNVVEALARAVTAAR